MHQRLFKPSPAFRFSTFLIALACLFPAVGSITAQRKPGGNTGAEEPPTFQEYRGVQLGMSAADVRKKLGDPKDKSRTGLLCLH